MLQIVLVLVKENSPKIQSIIDEFSASTVNNLLDDPSIKKKSTAIINDILKDGLVVQVIFRLVNDDYIVVALTKDEKDQC